MNGLPQRQRGVAMLVAILLVALGTIIAAAVAYESAMTARRGNATIDFDEALLVGEGAEALAGYGLQQIMRNSQGSTSGTQAGGGSGTNQTGSGKPLSGTNGGAGVPNGGSGGIDIYPSQAWAERIGPLEVVPGVMLEASMEDLQGRFNLNWLVDPGAQATGGNGNPLTAGGTGPQSGQLPNQGTQGGGQNATGLEKATSARAVFTRLLELVHIDPQWTDKIVDWIDSNQMPEPQGAEDSAYLSQNPPYLAANQYLTSTTELLAIPGFGRENYLKLAPYITALPPEGTTLNLCTALGIVLDAVKGNGSEWSDQDALDKNRTNAAGCFPTANVFNGTVDPGPTKAFASGMVGTTSRYFRLTSLVTIGTAEFNLYSLLFVDGAGYYVHPIQRSFTPD